MKKINLFSITIFMATLIFSCNRGPKVIAAKEEDQTTEQSSGIFDNASNETHEETQNSGNTGNFMDHLHSVVVNKTLPADKYVYLNVSENGKIFGLQPEPKRLSLAIPIFIEMAF